MKNLCMGITFYPFNWEFKIDWDDCHSWVQIGPVVFDLAWDYNEEGLQNENL